MPTTFRRRRCRFCRGWFRPNARKGDKQYACSKPECQLVRQIRNEEARLVRDPAYFRARVVKPQNRRPAPRETRRSIASYEDVRDHVMHKVITLQLTLMPRVGQMVADPVVHKVITAQLAIIVGLVSALKHHDVHKEIDLDLIALHDCGRRQLAGGDRGGEARPG